MVVFDHAVGFDTEAGLTRPLGAEVSEDVHARGIEVAEEGLAGLSLLVHPVERGSGELVVDGFHALYGERAGVFYSLLADFAERRINSGVVLVGGPAVHDAARTELGFETRVFGVVRIFGFFFGVEVVEVAEELVEAVEAGEEGGGGAG